MNKLEILKSEANCDVCKQSEYDELCYGEMLRKSNITVHYFCLLFATKLPQNGRSDSYGIRRFLINDIKDLIKKSRRKKCFYCRKPYASILCSNQICKKWFHLICGIKNMCQLEFCDYFYSYCNEHYTIKEIPYTDLEYYYCFICRSQMGAYHPITSIPSCSKCNRDWFHAKCLKPYAINAGYYFKCLVCGNKDYVTQARKRGIYVPDTDAAWEKEIGAYPRTVIYTCEADQCLCARGRKFNELESGWGMNVCDTCSGFGIHEKCRANSRNEGYCCKLCTFVIQRLHSEHNDSNITSNNINLNSDVTTNTSNAISDHDHNDMFVKDIEELPAQYDVDILNTAFLTNEVDIANSDEIIEISSESEPSIFGMFSIITNKVELKNFADDHIQGKYNNEQQELRNYRLKSLLYR